MKLIKSQAQALNLWNGGTGIFWNSGKYFYRVKSKDQLVRMVNDHRTLYANK